MGITCSEQAHMANVLLSTSNIGIVLDYLILENLNIEFD